MILIRVFPPIAGWLLEILKKLEFCAWQSCDIVKKTRSIGQQRLRATTCTLISTPTPKIQRLSQAESPSDGKSVLQAHTEAPRLHDSYVLVPFSPFLLF